MLSKSEFNQVMAKTAKSIGNGGQSIYFPDGWPERTLSVEQIEILLQFGMDNQVNRFYLFHLDTNTANKTLNMLENYHIKSNEICTLILHINSPNNLDALRGKRGSLTSFFQRSIGRWHLDFTQCYMHTVTPKLRHAMISNRSVERLDLWRSPQGYQGGLIARLLRENSVLKALNLSEGPFLTNEIEEIVEALKTNRFLEHVKWNFLRHYTHHQVQLIAEGALNNSSSLESIELTCYNDIKLPSLTGKNSHLRSLYLYGFLLDEIPLENLLMVNFPQLSSLRLSCKLSIEALQRLIAIINDLNLETLYLGGGDIFGAYEQQAALFYTLADNKTLKELTLTPPFDSNNVDWKFDRREDHPRKYSHPAVTAAFIHMLRSNDILRKIDVSAVNEFSQEEIEVIATILQTHHSIEDFGGGITMIKPEYFAYPHQDLSTATRDHCLRNRVYHRNEYLRFPLLSIISANKSPIFERQVLNNIFSYANFTIKKSLEDVRVKSEDFIRSHAELDSPELQCAQCIVDHLSERDSKKAFDLASQHLNSNNCALQDICRSLVMVCEKIDLTIDKNEANSQIPLLEGSIPAKNQSSSAQICRKIGLFAAPIFAAAASALVATAIYRNCAP